VRQAAVLVGLQGAVGAILALVFLVRRLAGADRHIVDGYATAAIFGIFGAVLLLAGWALWTGRRWGRGIGIYAQMTLLPVSWYFGVGSHQWGYAIPLALVAIAVLVLLFSPATIQWMTGGVESAREESSGPDTR
jgi:hypothetical protein